MRAALRASLREQLAALRGVPQGELPRALLDVRVDRFGDLFVLRPSDWEQLRHEEGGAGRPVPYWATPWPSGRALAAAVAAAPPAGGSRVLEVGCGLALPSIAAGERRDRAAAVPAAGRAPRRDLDGRPRPRRDARLPRRRPGHVHLRTAREGRIAIHRLRVGARHA